MQTLQYVQYQIQKEIMANLRERRRLRTADTIRIAAIDLVFEHGLESVTTEMISEEAGISPRTFFNYFPYKEAALLPPEPEFAPEAEEKFVCGTGPILEDLAELLLPLAYEFGEDGSQLRKLFQISHTHPKLMMLKVSAFQDFKLKVASVLGRRLKDEDDGEKLALMAALVSTTIQVAMGHWIQADEGEVTEYIGKALLQLPTVFDH